ncbi:MAG: DNA-binding protein [Lamprobacter sp.]|uniref:DNA-binding protein n=1 Tax=Lamprobacter sp. TaxID=3100796 RepID=UPI002B25DB8C|nr:DNA-binding protein [Lamprobacter sp.]MEA3640780.1 DNA-binding protein [Lamprobacter sp.]
MTRQPPITLDDTRQAIYACLTACEAPSADRLLAHLGRGSKTTVLKYRDQVIDEIRAQLKGHTLPAGVPETLQAPIAAFWQAAQEGAFARLADERAAMQQQVDAAHQEREVAVARTAAADQARERTNALADERQALIETLRDERDQAREEGRAAQRAHEQVLQTLQASHGAERDGLRQQVEQSRVLVEELRLEQVREREVAVGQEQHYVRVIEEVRVERDALKQRLEAQACEHQQRVQELSQALASQQRQTMQAEVELGVARWEVERLRQEVAEGAKALAEVRVREQVAVAQRDQAREAERVAQEAEEGLRCELDALRV